MNYLEINADRYVLDINYTFLNEHTKVLPRGSRPFNYMNGICILPCGEMRQYNEYAMHGYIGINATMPLYYLLKSLKLDTEDSKLCTEVYETLYMSSPLMSIKKEYVKTSNITIYTKQQLLSLLDYMNTSKITTIETEEESLTPHNYKLDSSDILNIIASK